jgi:hypothetical protein
MFFLAFKLFRDMHTGNRWTEIDIAVVTGSQWPMGGGTHRTSLRKEAFSG